MNLSDILTLFEYDGWATSLTLESVSSLSEGKYQEDLKSSHGGIHGTLVHIYSANMIWLGRWKGSSLSAHLDPGEIPTLESLKIRWKDYRNVLNGYITTLTEAKLQAALPYNDLKGNHHAEPLYQQMLQIINHASYHRGQIVTMLRQLGSKPQATDLILFYRTRHS